MCWFDENAYMVMRVDDDVEEFVNVCLDFSIAQYMEDCSFWQTNKQKNFAYLEKKQKKYNFTDILECSINKKKTIIKTIVKKAHKSP